MNGEQTAGILTIYSNRYQIQINFACKKKKEVVFDVDRARGDCN